MANNSNNQINIPEAREAMYNMKHEVANELGITLNQGYNGNISAKDAGHIGDNMVNIVLPVRQRKEGRKAAAKIAQNSAIPGRLRHRPSRRPMKYRLGKILFQRLRRVDPDASASAGSAVAPSFIRAHEHSMRCEGRRIDKKIEALEYRAWMMI